MMFINEITMVLTLLAATTLGLVPAAAPAIGEMTYYDPNTGNQVACGGFFQPADRIAAVGAAHFDGKDVCGKVASVTHNGKTVTAVIRDRCEACKPGDIDVTPTVFQELAPLGAGRVPGVSWTLA
ncbi:hypothetical protein KVR01_001810 [Diaporthe batatas]|uniref:uncharacterized protein n=1 Tax=Diaporthe batatas TaxID=748121 RepID=UPI001D03DF15|nr:uncharacterized protein KVR01_001810 [Diaporthe batatas]KAG8169061.1 hypothetical protein KVR01_001810 [Diaporthe batatas]